MNRYRYSVLLSVVLTTSLFSQNSLVNDTIPLGINEQNTIYVKAVFNNMDTLTLNFDTGTSDLILTKKTLATKLKEDVKLYHTLYKLNIGKNTYQTMVFDAELSGHGTDGRFGWDLFKGAVVELNYDQGFLAVHTTMPEYILKDNLYSKLTIHYFQNVFSVESSIFQDDVEAKDLFLFDTGYQRTVMLDNELMRESKFPFDKMEKIKEVMMKGAQGNEVPVITSKLDIFKIGDHILEVVPAQLITLHKPMKGKNIHIVGNEVLKRFNTFLDFQNNVIYLKPNKFYYEDYIEQRK